MKKINAQIIADSIDERGNRITSFILTYPRFIHAELMTHRMFSRNSASSRAIPFEKMLKMVNDDCFIPIAWQRDHKGMQGTEYINPHTDPNCSPISDWLEARDHAMNTAEEMNADGVTKQLVNRLLEPFMWHTVLVTATEFSNFFDLRCPKYKTQGLAIDTCKSKKDWLHYMQYSSALPSSQYPNTLIDWLKINESQAEIHMQALAEAVWDSYNESTPTKLLSGQWHIPFGNQMDEEAIESIVLNSQSKMIGTANPEWIQAAKLKVSIARCARLSYMTFENEINYEKDIILHDQLLKSKHSSPFEHVARCMTDLEYYSFIKGEYPTGRDNMKNIFNYEVYAKVIEEDSEWIGFSGVNPNTKDLYGWSNNFRGFIPYRYIIEKCGKN